MEKTAKGDVAKWRRELSEILDTNQKLDRNVGKMEKKVDDATEALLGKIAHTDKMIRGEIVRIEGGLAGVTDGGQAERVKMQQELVRLEKRVDQCDGDVETGIAAVTQQLKREIARLDEMVSFTAVPVEAVRSSLSSCERRLDKLESDVEHCTGSLDDTLRKHQAEVRGVKEQVEQCANNVSEAQTAGKA
eukprot:NODE_2216_length_743_cov_61.850144_g1788_i0.p1 GENE.NODE_2216_length_743_cov_61.850144_g1788_i0~~NODE_2216_length_743_cov_61.850144_g1788_i0.p1  ORF type:complete len:190 (+),score=42.44 NODE_2216_length_743_cov_61.850144_g1788_i0:172-741(+)